MNSIFRTLTLTSVIFSVTGFAHAALATTNTVGSIRGAPGPEIGDGVVGFAVAAAILLTVLMLPRIKRLLRAKTV